MKERDGQTLCTLTGSLIDKTDAVCLGVGELLEVNSEKLILHEEDQMALEELQSQEAAT